MLLFEQNTTFTPGDSFNETEITNRTSPSNRITEHQIFMKIMSGPLFFSDAERAIAITSMIIMLVFGLTGNALVVFFITRDSRNHTPYMTTIACFAVSDFAALACYYLPSLYVSIVNSVNIFRHTYYNISCAIQRVLLVSASLSQTECIGLIAMERYLYFGHPYLHQRWVTVKRVLLAEFLIYSLSFLYQLLAASLAKAYYSITLLECTAYGAKWYFLPTMIIWIDIPAAITLVIVIKLTYMILKKRRQIRAEEKQIATVSANVGMREAAATTSNDDASRTGTHRAGSGSDTEERPDSNLQAIKNHIKDNVVTNTMVTAVKLVGCISLSYWLTYIPCVVALHKMFDSVSFVDVELGRSPKWHFLIRYFYFFGLPVSTSMNPIFHFYFNKPLNRVLRRMFRIRKPATERETTATEVEIL